MTTAYAYTRVSTAAQDKEGKTGIVRQLESISDFLKQHPTYKLSENTYTDKASGYHGMNMKDDAGLGSFLRDCDKGIVKAGDMLCVELVDRLSRLPPDDARELFRRILSYGVKVAIVRWGIVIDKTENRLDLAGDLLLTVGFHLAHMESEQKSKRIFAAKQRNVKEAREKGKVFTRGAPRWLEVNEDRTAFNVKVEDAEIIKRIFEMKLNGLGTRRILMKLKDENSLMLGGKRLQKDSIRRLLINRRLLGEWQPQHRIIENGKEVRVNNGAPIKDYYPRIISDELFNAVQASFKSTPKGKAARGFSNVLSGLLRCSSCGKGMSFKRSYSKGEVKRIYYACIGQSDHAICDRKYAYMPPIRDGVINALSILDYSQLYNSHTALENSIQLRALQGKRGEVEKVIKNLTYAIANAESEDDISDLMALRNEKRRELTEIDHEASELNNMKEKRTTEGLKETIELDLDNEDERIKLNNLLHQHIDRIVLFESGICSINFKIGYNQIKRVVVDTSLDKGDKGFIQYITENDHKHMKDVLPEDPKKAVDYFTNLARMVIAGNNTPEEALKEAEQLSPIAYEAVRHALKVIK